MVAATHDKVLVIDDELGPRESIRFLLKGDYEVLCASSVDQGVRLLADRFPDLVIMDIRMPGKTGIEGLREIRAIDREVSVVMLTGYGALETAQEALRLGATDYQNKPFDTQEMREAVKRYVERTKIERRRASLLGDLRQVNKRLVEDLASKEELASLAQATAEIAHDMRNPLMIVSGYVELLTSQIEQARDRIGPEFERTVDYLDVIGQNVRRCCELSHMWQKYGKNKLTEKVPTSMAEVMDDVVLGAAPLAASENVSIHYDIRSRFAVINGSRAQLLRALHNVIANAIQAVSGPDGRVDVCCEEDSVTVRVSVTDNGCGMTPAVQARIFEPYFTTKDSAKGTGLGMVITKKIIEEHGGTIAVDSRVGVGTTVTMSLPLIGSTAANVAA